MSISKYHHLVPQTYLSTWANNSGTLQIMDVKTGSETTRNKENFCGVNHYHSIIAGMPFCTKADTDKIFASLSVYAVKYQGVTLTDSLDMNRLFGAFDEWEICRPDGSPVRKKMLKHEILQVKIQDIEEMWSSNYENKWPDVRSHIEREVLSGLSKVPSFEFDYLMEIFTAMDWRSASSNALFDEMFNNLSNKGLNLDEIIFDEDEKDLPFFNTAADYIKHCILLDYYRQFLCKRGVIYKHSEANKLNTSFCFLVANGKTRFITSDNPAFLAERTDAMKVGIMPITPEILMVQGKNSSSDKNYYISHIDDEQVEEYNKVIENNALEFIVKPQ